ncbi:SUMF1/EgtB/PvdO family nonheme iron enzyme [Luteolibacter pohnpeiensis]|uniref:SUMF1/EgtB/PvdO family nonheme iron enzyme n=1 Tax=Luteolibacter pohnpeiensis TaxID=454153 RepID=A0A934SBK6_9BACT|nr:SUMF1/EgtB/PvdO family nonheme iron enzyme [Luteolibacter pohnpeiensis]MBK1883167.1 SUMF1/EgtB/PvdO family nonheme iron enzyme [Luteolibacter pohnpeiensis]
MESNTEARQLGDYLLKEAVWESSMATTWLAEQVSIRRPVYVDELKSEHADQTEAFLADVRVKAAIHQSAFASIYEAVSVPDQCFFAYEILEGKSLAELARKKTTMDPQVLVGILERISEISQFLESESIANVPLGAEDCYLLPNGGVRLANLAIAGEREPGTSQRDIAALGRELPRLVAKNRPASGRLLVLLAWMRGEGDGVVQSWADLQGYCREIHRQLQEHPPKKRQPAILASVAAAVILAGLLVFIFSRHQAPDPNPGDLDVQPAAPISVSAGQHVGVDGAVAELPAFAISARPISVGEYVAFLQALDILKESHLEKTYNHRQQPDTKSGHVPDAWEPQKAGNPANPVTGVDWWDASAYANWKKSRLPNQDEWFAALDKSDPIAVYEWTEKMQINPANPAGGTFWTIIRMGPSRPQREWLEDRSVRRPDIGFRILTEKKS